MPELLGIHHPANATKTITADLTPRGLMFDSFSDKDWLLGQPLGNRALSRGTTRAHRREDRPRAGAMPP
jgi:hypothetical protein